MVKFVIGKKGAGKTKWLIDNANNDLKEGNENIVFIDVDDNHIFSLDYNVRLINAMEFNINNVESFYGFLCGILSMNYDLEKVYVDGIYKVTDIKLDDLTYLLGALKIICKKYKVEFYINVDFTLDMIPEDLQEYCIELDLVVA